MTTALLIGCTVALIATALYVAADQIQAARARRKADRDFQAVVAVAPTPPTEPRTFLPDPYAAPTKPSEPWGSGWVSPSERKGL